MGRRKYLLSSFLTLCLQGNFACFLLSAVFFKIKIFEKFFQENIIRVSRSGPTFGGPDQNVGPDLGPNCLQRLSADDTSRKRVKVYSIDILKEMIYSKRMVRL